ncbi:MAG: hydroxymethylbilane synthase [Bacteroidetes bacterium]|nr:MAG: hydroxymethylbilane synthase [Bacteroidota bacterium]
MNKIIIGSRGSELALWQADFVLHELKKIKIEAEIKIIKTQGDIVQNLSWDKMEGKGFFTKEIEEALLKNEIDLAVHSHKDLPTDPVKGLIIAAVSEREDPSELLLINKNAVDDKQKFSLKKNAYVGTSSARRKSQMLAWRPDVKPEDLRGNVPTRIQKLRNKKYDAILIANAGVSRLEIDLSEFHCEKLDPKEFMPAPAQGVLALQIREADKDIFRKLQALNHKAVAETIFVERKILNLFQGGCQLPLGVYCEKDENENLTPNPSPKERGNTIYRVWVSKAEKWNSFPRYFYFESKKTEDLAEKIISKMKAAVCPPLEGAGGGAVVFISRNEKKNDFFKRCLEASGYKVFCQSLIAIKQVPMRRYKKCDWVFFSGKNAVKHFFEQKPDAEGVKFGAVGKATAEEIRKFGKRADFIGSSGDMRMTGKKFSALLGNKTVLFPQAKESMKTIQLQLPKRENVVDLIVYETLKNNDCQLPIANCHFFVFTSPSNVETFFEKNKISASQKVIAMGDATANSLKKFGVRANKQPASFDDLGLVQAVMSM